MDLDLNQYINLFVEEAKEHLQSMNEALLELEKDKANISLINELFRVAHTLKGMSGTMGFENMANLTHEMENVLEGIRSNDIELNENVIDIIFECFDVLDYSVNEIATKGKESSGENKDLIDRLRTVLKDNSIIENNEYLIEDNIPLDDYVLNIIEEAKTKGLNIFNIEVNLSPKCMLKSARAFIIFNTLESMGDIVYSNPSVEDIEDEKFDLGFSIIFISRVEKEKLEGELNNISEIDEIKITGVEGRQVAKVDHELVKEVDSIRKDINELVENGDKARISNRENRIGKTVRVDIDRLDNLMNLVSELIIIKTRMDDLSDISNKENMIEAIEYLERITTSLHDAVMKVRMVPIERVFNRFPRMVRDLSKELNKEINLQMYGEDTEVDRTVIDEIGDPLIHIIRNSIDHGIETPEERKNQNKLKEGTVILKAYPDGNNVVVEVADDGKGIDIGGIKKKAIEKEIITSQEAEILTEDDIKTLLFQPGFSTSEEISDISGRGVGLDVVKSKIESINGSIEIDSELNVGTKFIIRIPLTLAIIQALLIKLKDEIYAIPLSSITEITGIDKDSIRNIQGQDIILYRGKTIPFIRLHKLMELEFTDNYDEYLVVVVRKGEKEAALLVDSLIGQQEIVIKPLGKYLSNIKYLSGATILGNGKVSLILDINSII
ncbi:chemotaxis protein CheA [Clostridium sp. Cult2]|uniref:chemotaxis protein CheA n=1 Tax=Clostridium sp. Cult2 TaxID=2079003 RepID=UPI001F3566DA|nr:chemotaxis protein CheA [Clostridium sp. Cult2]MCF6464715.1 chemotaxis protein CheA [Clostridium sp. Cult2]